MKVSQNSMTSLAARACGFDKALANSFSEKEHRLRVCEFRRSHFFETYLGFGFKKGIVNVA